MLRYVLLKPSILDVIKPFLFFNVASNIPSKGLWIVSNVDVRLHCSKTRKISLPQRLKTECFHQILYLPISQNRYHYPIKYKISYTNVRVLISPISIMAIFHERITTIFRSPNQTIRGPDVFHNYMWRHKAFSIDNTLSSNNSNEKEESFKIMELDSLK